MKYSYENSTFTIYLEGKIDAGNVINIFKEILRARQGNPKGNMVLDLENLQELSREGLKVLTALQKQEPNLMAVNVNPKIYELLDKTGLTFLIQVKKALKKLSLNSCELLGQTARGSLYRLDEETIAKQYMPGISTETLERERKYTQILSDYGIPALSAHEIVQCEQGYATLYKVCNAETLSAAIRHNPDKMEEYINMYATLLKCLHTTEIKADTLPDAKEIYLGRINTLAKYLVEEEFLALQKLITSIPDKNAIIHGDFHAGNIMLQDNKLILIGMEDLSSGHPVFDFLSMYLSHVTLATIPEQLAKTLSLTTEQCEKLWKGTLKSYFRTGAESYLGNLERQMEVYSGVKEAWCSAIGSAYAQDPIEQALTKMRKNVLPAIPTATGKLPF